MPTPPKYSLQTPSPYYIHLKPYARQTHHQFPVHSLGFFFEKTEVIRRTYSTINFSVILEGDGFLKTEDFNIKIKAPCVFFPLPGQEAHYGPNEWWREFFIVYEAHYESALRHRGFWRDSTVWPISDIDKVVSRLALLADQCNTINSPLVADKIDLLAELALLETLPSVSRANLSREEKCVYDFWTLLNSRFYEQFDFSAAIKSMEMHTNTFRRHWKQICPVSPGRYLRQLRMNEACRRLVHSTSSIGAIAKAVGYDDPLFFSRIFKKETGTTAFAYRKQNRVY